MQKPGRPFPGFCLWDLDEGAPCSQAIKLCRRLFPRIKRPCSVILPTSCIYKDRPPRRVEAKRKKARVTLSESGARWGKTMGCQKCRSDPTRSVIRSLMPKLLDHLTELAVVLLDPFRDKKNLHRLGRRQFSPSVEVYPNL